MDFSSLLMLSFFPASRSSTFMPCEVSTCAAMPPAAPEPTTTASYTRLKAISFPSGLSGEKHKLTDDHLAPSCENSRTSHAAFAAQSWHWPESPDSWRTPDSCTSPAAREQYPTS